MAIDCAIPVLTRREMVKMTAAAALSGDRILDPHVHVWSHDPQFPFASGAQVPDYDATPEMLLELMKTNGMAKTVIIQVSHYRYDNSYLAQSSSNIRESLKECVGWTRSTLPRRITSHSLQSKVFEASASARRRWRRRLDSGPADGPLMEALPEPQSSHDVVDPH